MEFINYEHNETNSNSLASDWAECLLVDSLNILWVGTFGKGLDRFDPGTNSFRHFRHDLGLRLSYDIVKAHGGEIKVETKEEEFTEFVIQIPAM